jgi:hypothetical protein
MPILFEPQSASDMIIRELTDTMRLDIFTMALLDDDA